MTGSEAEGVAEIATSCGAALACAGAGFGAVDVVDHGEIGGLGVVGDLDPHGGERRIVGEADVKLGLPGHRGDLDRGLADRDAGPRPGQQLAAREHGGNEQAEQPRPESSKRNMIRTRSAISPRNAGLMVGRV